MWSGRFQDLDVVLKHGELRMLTDRQFNFFKSALWLGVEHLDPPLRVCFLSSSR